MWNIKYIITVLFFLLLMYAYTEFFLSLLFLSVLMLTSFILSLRIFDGVKFLEMPRYFYNFITNPFEKMVRPILQYILMGFAFLGLCLFIGIFMPFTFQIIKFMKFGTWEMITLNNLTFDYLREAGSKITIARYYNIPDWRGIEKILNWFFFEANASLAFLILLIIYICVMFLILKLLGADAISKILDDDSKK